LFYVLVWDQGPQIEKNSGVGYGWKQNQGAIAASNPVRALAARQRSQSVEKND